jgi:predicted Holliday junction resolvase-like endonuclease
MNYKVLFWISVVIIVLLLAVLFHIKERVETIKTTLKESFSDASRIFYEMNGYLREYIIGNYSEPLKAQFEYSVDKLSDAIKDRIPSINVDKLKKLKSIVSDDAKTVIANLSSALNLPEPKVTNYVNAVKSQIANVKAGQMITSSINHEDASNALGEMNNILSYRVNVE